MGSSASKATRGAARQYPSRSAGAAVSQTQAATRTHPKAEPFSGDGSKDEAIRADGGDPDLITRGFSDRLKQMGVVQPNPTFSPSSTAVPQSIDGPYAPPSQPQYPSARKNTTLSVLSARRQLQQQADDEFEAMGRASSPGRRFVDMRTMVQIMELRGRGMPATEIEKRLSLQSNILAKLGRSNIITHLTN